MKRRTNRKSLGIAIVLVSMALSGPACGNRQDGQGVCLDAARMAAVCLGAEIDKPTGCPPQEAAAAQQLLDRGCEAFPEGKADDYLCTVLSWLPGCDQGRPLVALFNSPECGDPGCNRSGGTLEYTVGLIGAAEETIDLAVYGINEQRIVDALCAAAAKGVSVRVVSDDSSFDETASHYYEGLSYFEALAQVGACGGRTVPVTVAGLMHHKFYLIDAETGHPIILSGSQNQTRTGFNENHNNIVVMLAPPQDVVDAYRQVFDNMFGEGKCTGVTPAVDRAGIGDLSVDIYFSPSGGILDALRGKMEQTSSLTEPDPACLDPEANCICRRYKTSSGARWRCTYCSLDEGGYGLIGTARDRIYASVFHMTDECMSLAVRHASLQSPSLEALFIWDSSASANYYNVDEIICGIDLPVYISRWPSDERLPAKNHNKIIVVDDSVVTGSMNFSESGSRANCENVIVIHDRDIADEYAVYLEADRDILLGMGQGVLGSGLCRCTDSVDNDGDELVDKDDPACDAEQPDEI
ncbi:MAG: phosphatidylserine/phosphatidylglycerophosphate/cardiolipin synthase family protein [Pseudomonadota bacterium]